MELQYKEEDLIRVMRCVILKNLGIEDVSVDASFSEDLKMDEPTRVEILLAVEHSLGVEIALEELYAIDSIAQAVKFYRKTLQEMRLKKQSPINFLPFA